MACPVDTCQRCIEGWWARSSVGASRHRDPCTDHGISTAVAAGWPAVVVRMKAVGRKGSCIYWRFS